MKSPSPKGHPAIVFSDVRAQAWEKVAEDEDFFRYLDGLINIYAKRLYNADGDAHKMFTEYEPRLLEDYQKWKDKNPW